jgi:Domain of unknown function (DUF6259)/Viral BACON domain
MILPRHGLPAMVLFAFALLQAQPASAQISVNGRTLTVTTTNAVATFNGADLVGFVNSLTAESYLKKPSDGHLAFVNSVTQTGQLLQASNWTIASETGTGLPVATVTLSDSVRSMIVTVKIDPASQEIVLRSSANVTSPGVRGASWVIAGLDLTSGRWIVPAHSGEAFDRNNPGVNAYIAYPFPWLAQMAVYETSAGSFLLYSTDTQYVFKELQQTTRGDDTLDVGVYTEAAAPWPSATTVPVVEWRLKAFAGNWRAAAQPYRDWMIANRPPLSNAQHPWVSNIRTVVMMNGTAADTPLLAQLAAVANPSQTLLYLVGWRRGGYVGLFPDYTPGPDAASFVAAAHALGFKVMLHFDSVGVDPNSPDYPALQQYQARTPDSLDLLGWDWSAPPNTPDRYATISPASNAFRTLLLARYSAAINALGPDALHLDFNVAINDGNGLIDGRTFIQGQILFDDALVAAFPNLAIGIEWPNDITYRYHAFGQAGYFGSPLGAGHPISTYLFDPQVLIYGHLATPNVSDPTFKNFLLRQQLRGVFPMWRVTSTDDLDTTNADNARFFGLVRSFQTQGFRPAWTDDSSGALVRYQGLAGSTAALTDSSNILTLTGAGSTLFQLAHDANQVTTGSFIRTWPAFDSAALYGLDPTQLYFVDPVPRPGATHVTSLPPGIRLGAGTVVTPTFTHIELAPPAGYDFTNLSRLRLGVTYQGVDYPLAYGAVVLAQSDTVAGESRASIYIHPPWQGQIGGETFAEYALQVPANAALQFSVGIGDGSTCTDGVTFRVTVGGVEAWSQNFNRGAWHDVVLSLAQYAGTTIALRLIANPGPAANTGCDGSLWSRVGLAAPTLPINVPVALAGGSTFSGIDGASYTPTSSTSGTVTNAAIPGAFTIFTQPGAAAGSGTNLATLPFDVWHWGKDGAMLQPGSVFGAGGVQAETARGVTKNPAIWAHPPSAQRTVLSWALRLPANPLALNWSAGLIDGANSDDGVDFSVWVNGAPYWTLTAGAHGDDQWSGGQLNLARWAGQSVFVELITDSRSNFNGDWAAWADLVLNPSSVSCMYIVPATASVGSLGGSFSATVTAPATCPWLATSNVPWLTLTSGSGAGNGSLMYAVAPNAGSQRSGTLTIGGQTLTVTQDPSPAPSQPPPPLPPTMALDRRSLNVAAVSNGTAFLSQTGAQTVQLTQSGAGTVSWTASCDAPWLVVSPSSGKGPATLSVSVTFDASVAAAGSATGHISLTVTGAAKAVGPVTMTLTTVAVTAPVSIPFGSFDTPAGDGTVLAGSIAVTGWTLDNVGVKRVELWRDLQAGETTPPFPSTPSDPRNGKVFLSNATFVEGARPDVEGLYPSTPFADRAGWGYLLLTWGLWNQGNGTYKLYAFAFDQENNVSTIGNKTIVVGNNTATKPFGSIDTPGIGGDASGPNFGWGLTPKVNGLATCKIQPSGVQVSIDSGPLQPVVYGDNRTDIAGAFPGFSNSDTAGGHFLFDWSALTNGTHTIGWLITDGCNRADGVGSRFFNVTTGTNLTAAKAGPVSAIAAPLLAASALRPNEPESRDTITVARGYGELPKIVEPGEGGSRTVEVKEGERIEIRLPRGFETAYQLVNGGARRVLPTGATWDAATGTFSWQPAAGFLGRYRLVFSNGTERISVRVIIMP